MEWKKSPKVEHSRKASTADAKISNNIQDKSTKRRPKSKHKKMLTEGVPTYASNSLLTSTAPKKGWIHSLADDTTIC